MLRLLRQVYGPPFCLPNAACFDFKAGCGTCVSKKFDSRQPCCYRMRTAAKSEMSVKETVRYLWATAINDKRPCEEYSWRWLNRLAERLTWSNSGASIRPQYAWGTVMAGAQARALKQADCSLIEFGVAGGNGLLALQTIAAEVSSIIGVRLNIFGFDTGAGLPDVQDVRDMPQVYKRGDYRMDFETLEKRLAESTKLVIGNVNETVEDFLKQPHSPVGFVSFDMDLYTSTRDALALFRGAAALINCLPRVVCYFDDVMGVTMAAITGERLAIREYNEAHRPFRCVSPVYGLRYDLGWPQNRAQWPDMMYWAHFLDRPDYGTYDGLVPYTQATL